MSVIVNLPEHMVFDSITDIEMFEQPITVKDVWVIAVMSEIFAGVGLFYHLNKLSSDVDKLVDEFIKPGLEQMARMQEFEGYEDFFDLVGANMFAMSSSFEEVLPGHNYSLFYWRMAQEFKGYCVSRWAYSSAGFNALFDVYIQMFQDWIEDLYGVCERSMEEFVSPEPVEMIEFLFDAVCDKGLQIPPVGQELLEYRPNVETAAQAVDLMYQSGALQGNLHKSDCIWTVRTRLLIPIALQFMPVRHNTPVYPTPISTLEKLNAIRRLIEPQYDTHWTQDMLLAAAAMAGYDVGDYD